MAGDTNHSNPMTFDEMREKVSKGTQLAIDRMIEWICKDDLYVVVSDDNGKVVKIRARDIKRRSGQEPFAE